MDAMDGGARAPGDSGDGGDRAEMHDAPPFLTWRAIYLVVLGALALEIVLAAVLTLVAR
ncbi:MAG TPA: hypothetical protein VH853_02170 [Polyangia bacterium]|jgi:hypothetical protein|nr:hypothetical protein [Polyangia bacterium]